MKKARKLSLVGILGLITAVLFLTFIVSFWSCKSPLSPENEGPLSPETKDSFGEVLVYSQPWHAYIWLDGYDTGERTNAFLSVSVGTHTIMILKEGYIEWETTITVTAENVGENYILVDAKLQPLRITVTNPTANMIWIKGQEVEITWEIENTLTSSVSTGNDFNQSNSSGNVFSPSFRRVISHERSFRHFTRTRKRQDLRNIVSPSYEKRSSHKSFRVDSDSKKFSSEDVENINLKKTKLLYLPHVKIYLYKGDSEVLTIVTELENKGSYKWTVDPSLEDGTDYIIRLNVWPEKVTNLQYIYWMSDEFTIKGND